MPSLNLLLLYYIVFFSSKFALFSLKQGQQETQKLSSLKALKIYPPPPSLLKTRFCATKPSEMASISNSWRQIRKERPHLCTNNGDMDEKQSIL